MGGAAATDHAHARDPRARLPENRQRLSMRRTQACQRAVRIHPRTRPWWLDFRSAAAHAGMLRAWASCMHGRAASPSNSPPSFAPSSGCLATGTGPACLGPLWQAIREAPSRTPALPEPPPWRPVVVRSGPGRHRGMLRPTLPGTRGATRLLRETGHIGTRHSPQKAAALPTAADRGVHAGRQAGVQRGTLFPSRSPTWTDRRGRPPQRP